MPRGRSAWHECRRRVDALHAARDKTIPASLTTSSSESHEHLDHDVPQEPFSEWMLPPQTLARALHQQVIQLPLGTAMKAKLYRDALPLARWANKRDPSINVCALFSTERAWSADTIRATLCTRGPARWKAGQAENGSDTPTLPDIRVDASGLLDTARDHGVINATLSREPFEHVIHGDPLRPPQEALHLVAEATRATQKARDTSSDLHVVAVEMGHTWAAQALSQQLPWATIHCTGETYRPWPDIDTGNGVAGLVVVNIPSIRTCRIMDTLTSEEAPRSWRRRVKAIQQGDINPTRDIQAILALAHPYLKPGTILALMGDRETYHQALAQLRGAQDIIPLTINGWDSSKRATLVRYPRRPWSPWMIPAPTDRLVSMWSIR